MERKKQNSSSSRTRTAAVHVQEQQQFTYGNRLRSPCAYHRCGASGVDGVVEEVEGVVAETMESSVILHGTSSGGSVRLERRCCRRRPRDEQKRCDSGSCPGGRRS